MGWWSASLACLPSLIARTYTLTLLAFTQTHIQAHSDALRVAFGREAMVEVPWPGKPSWSLHARPDVGDKFHMSPTGMLDWSPAFAAFCVKTFGVGELLVISDSSLTPYEYYEDWRKASLPV